MSKPKFTSRSKGNRETADRETDETNKLHTRLDTATQSPPVPRTCPEEAGEGEECHAEVCRQAVGAHADLLLALAMLARSIAQSRAHHPPPDQTLRTH